MIACVATQTGQLPTISSVSPSAWMPGNTYTVLITGNFPGNSTLAGCSYNEVDVGNQFINYGTWTGLDASNDDPNITISKAEYVSPTQISATVTVAPGAPSVTDYIGATCDGCDYKDVDVFPVQIGCPPPTITSLTPATWIAGQSYDITIIGTGFQTQSAASTACPETSLSVTEANTPQFQMGTGQSQPAGAPHPIVILSNVAVASSSEITATVSVPKSDPTETADVIVETPPNSATTPAQITHTCQIIKPQDNTPFPLDANNSTSTKQVPFLAKGSAQITWNIVIHYATSGGHANSSRNTTLLSNDNATATQTFQSMGGQGAVIATCGSPNNQDSAAIFVPGSAISRSAITERLYKLYASQNPPTPGLMTGIAGKESSTMQFKARYLYGLSALWPNESYDGGSHIGLMMVASSMEDGFDWTTNTQDGVTLFREKIDLAPEKRTSYRALRYWRRSGEDGAYTEEDLHLRVQDGSGSAG